MSGWPLVPHLEPGPTIHCLSPEAIGVEVASRNFLGANAASSAWPGASRLIAFPFVHLGRRPLVVARLFWFNGSAVSGNVDCAIYDERFRRVVSTGSTAQAGTSVLQGVAVSATLEPGATYHLALALDNTTGALMRLAALTGDLYLSGCWQQAAAFPCPATATPAVPSSAYLPMFGLSQRGFL